MPLRMLALLLVLALVPQSPTPSPQTQTARDTIRVQSNLVVLSVTVKDPAGHLVSGLHQDDFHVFDDNAEQKILAFTDEGLPLSLVILVDADMKWKEGSQMARSLRAAAAGLADTDEAIVCRYDMLFYPGNAFTSVYGNLISDLKATAAAAQPSPPYIPPPMHTDPVSTTSPPSPAAPTYLGSRPSKALEDALYSSAELLRDRPLDRRRVILLVSDGRDEPKLNHHSPGDVRDFLLENNASVYVLAVASRKSTRRFVSLTGYTSPTGGDIFYASDSDTISLLYSRITEQARHDYTLAYAPSGNDPSSHYHSLKVITSKPNLTASTRSGYFAGTDH